MSSNLCANTHCQDLINGGNSFTQMSLYKNIFKYSL